MKVLTVRVGNKGLKYINTQMRISRGCPLIYIGYLQGTIIIQGLKTDGVRVVYGVWMMGVGMAYNKRASR